MIDIVVSQLLVLVLLFIANFRVFGKNKKNQEVFVILAPVSLILSILLIFAWGLTFPTLLIIILAFLTCLINFYSLIRFFSKLMTGFYSLGLFIFSVLLQVLIVVAILFIVIMRPVSIEMEDIAVEEKTISIVGSYGIGFTERIDMFDRIDALVTSFYLIEEDLELQEKEQLEVIDDTRDIILENSVLEPVKDVVEEVQNNESDTVSPLVFIVTDPRENTLRLKPLAIQLALKGYEVVVADFYPSPFESFAKRFLGVSEKDYYLENKDIYTQKAVAQYAAIIEMYENEGKLDGRPVFLIGDGFCGDAAEKVFQLKPDVVAGFYSLNSKSSKGNAQKLLNWHPGFGFLSETAPWLLWILGSQDNFFACRDKLCFNSVIAASDAHKIFAAGTKVTD